MNGMEESVAAAQCEERIFRDLLPQDGFIADYMRYTDRQESPGSFHFWSVLTVLGACLQRRVWLSKGVYPVYPNLYTVLVAPTGRCRKTRAVSLALGIGEGFDWLNVIADKTSGEAFLEALMVGTQAMVTSSAGASATVTPPDSAGLVKAPELAVLLGKEAYSAGMINLLTDLYDCPDDFKYLTRNKRPVILHNVVVQLLGCTTPSWFSIGLAEDNFGGGFMSRIIFVVKDQRDRIISMPEAPHPDERQNLRKQLLTIRSVVKGELKLTPDALAWYTEWYNASALQPIDDVNLMGFIERKPDTVFKVAILLTAAKLGREIDLTTIKQAFEIVTWTQRKAFRAFVHINLTGLGRLKLRILEFIECKGGKATRRDIMRKFGGQFQNGVGDLKAIDEVLQQSGDVKIETETHHGRPTIAYTRLFTEAHE
jgi:hypothetical protein